MKQFALLGELADRLMTIQTANGYSTNAGDAVLINPDEVDANALEQPSLRVFQQESGPDGQVPNTTRCTIKTFFLVEGVGLVPSGLEYIEAANQLVQDICNAVFGGNVRMGQGNLQLQYEGHRILNRAAGQKAFVVQVRGSTKTPEVFAIPN
jgi:hypothetical protein